MDSWSQTKKHIEDRGFKCGHKGGRLSVDGVDLACCKGATTTCKVLEFETLISILRSKCDEIDTLRAEVTFLRQTPHVVNNFHNCVVIDGLSLARRALNDEGNIYEIAFHTINALPNSERKHYLLTLARSRDPCDKISYRREVMNIIADSIENSPNPNSEENLRIGKIVDVENEKISQDGRAFGMVEEVD